LKFIAHTQVIAYTLVTHTKTAQAIVTGAFTSEPDIALSLKRAVEPQRGREESEDTYVSPSLYKRTDSVRKRTLASASIRGQLSDLG